MSSYAAQCASDSRDELGQDELSCAVLLLVHDKIVSSHEEPVWNLEQCRQRAFASNELRDPSGSLYEERREDGYRVSQYQYGLLYEALNAYVLFGKYLRAGKLG